MQVESRTDELEAFKTRIDLCEFAASRGYVLDLKKSSRRSMVMRHSNGDKLIISRGASGHWKYFNAHDDRDRGTVIDFVQLRDRVSLGEVRKTLRGWKGANTIAVPSCRPALASVGPDRDRARVQREWHSASPLQGRHDFLQRERGIPASVLLDPVFVGRIRNNARGNALFAHHDDRGLSGFEVKNRGFTGFSPGGAKALFSSHAARADKQLVICETAIDALSYAALFGTSGKRLLSTAGQPSPRQLSLLEEAVRQLPDDGRVVLAVDNDRGGRRIADSVAQFLQPSALGGRRIETHMPNAEGQDWNDVLLLSRSPRRDSAPEPER